MRPQNTQSLHTPLKAAMQQLHLQRSCDWMT